MINTIKNFLRSMLSSKGEISSKRVAGLFALLNLVGMAWVATEKSGGVCPQFIFLSLISLCAAALGLTVAEKVWGNGNVNNK